MNGVVAQYWSIIPGGIHQVLHEPITGVDSFDILEWKNAAVQIGISRTPVLGVHLLITLTETHNIVLL